MERAEFNQCWSQISEEGVPTSTSIGATSQTFLFWEEAEAEMNKLLYELSMVGRSGKMICFIDDDKFHTKGVTNLSFEDATDATTGEDTI